MVGGRELDGDGEECEVEVGMLLDMLEVVGYGRERRRGGLIGCSLMQPAGLDVERDRENRVACALLRRAERSERATVTVEGQRVECTNAMMIYEDR